MRFVTFYQKSAIDANKLVEACGDRAIIILDGRNNAETHHAIAESECIKRGYLAYQRHIGESFTRTNWDGAVIRPWVIHPDNPASQGAK